MVKIYGVGVALFVLAVVIIVVAQGQDLAALVNGFLAEPVLAKLAWAVIVLVPLVLLPWAVWIGDSFERQRKSAQALESRLDGVKQGARDLAKSQADADVTVRHLVQTDPEESIGAIQQRLVEAERVTQVQQGRNEIGDLQSRVDELRVQQQSLKDRLAPALEKRRAIEQMFLDLDTRQSDLERALHEVASGDDATALDVRLKNLVEFIRQGHGRCDEIEQASKTIAGLNEEFAALRDRLSPYAAADDGVTQRVKGLSAVKDKLAADLDALQRTPQGALAERVQNFADDKKQLEDGVANLNLQFSKLSALRKDIDGLFANFDRALEVLSIGADGKLDVDSRAAELSTFIATTQAHVDDIERKLGMFNQLRARLGDLQLRLGPLEAADGGVVNVIEAVQGLRDKLTAKVENLEHGDDGDLAARVNALDRNQEGSRRSGGELERALRQARDDPKGHRRPVRQTEQHGGLVVELIHPRLGVISRLRHGRPHARFMHLRAPRRWGRFPAQSQPMWAGNIAAASP